MAWAEDEYCLLVNAIEGSPLWTLLADWTGGEDEAEWRRHVPRFAPLVAHWHRAGLVRLVRAAGWAYLPDTHQVAAADVPDVLADPDAWAWRASEEEVICVGLAAAHADLTGPPPRQPAA
ncbi:hypothetical protein [Streptomyces sp. NPDC005890]|uniref:hypothetical protein n=1 Tax=Streptomyces sp. NPDC005890 TaxID=3154568 RepID=UPI003406450B